MPTEKNLTAQSSEKSSEKEKADGQTFRLSVWNGIFEHCSKIKDAIWLFLLYIDWTTEEVEPDEETVQSSELAGSAGLEGIVLGGSQVCDSLTAKEFPRITGKTTRRWRKRLASHEFIRQHRKSFGYVIRVLKSKKWDADGAKGTFRIPVSTGILEHYKKLKSSIWLLLWYIDKTTIEENGQGKVLGGKPVRDSEPAGALGVSDDTIASWRENLELWKYVRTTRTPFGHTVVVAKSKKWVGKRRSDDVQKSRIMNSQTPVSLNENAQNQDSMNCRSLGRELPVSRVRIADSSGVNSQNAGNKEDIAVDFTRTGKGQNSACQPELLLRGTASPCDPPLTEKSEMHSNKKEKESSPALVLPATVLTERELRLQGFGQFMDGIGVGSKLPDSTAVRFLKDLFVMEPGLSPRRRLAALLEQGRIYRFNIPPELIAAKRRLDEAWRKEKERSAA